MVNTEFMKPIPSRLPGTQGLTTPQSRTRAASLDQLAEEARGLFGISSQTPVTFGRDGKILVFGNADKGHIISGSFSSSEFLETIQSARKDYHPSIFILGGVEVKGAYAGFSYISRRTE